MDGINAPSPDGETKGAPAMPAPRCGCSTG